jgi:tRNA uridine 5-carbamoylmethylation protein Kti12
MNMATTNVAAPLYITVGPQCAGKTTFLTQLEQRLSTTIEDITLDEQLDVYVQVPTEYFLQAEEEGMKDSFLQRHIQGKTLASRIYDLESNGELRAILQRLA